jgi:predicted nucleic acid-binding Zn ribbon protein
MLIDVQCQRCEEVSEIMVGPNDTDFVCPLCGSEAKRLWKGSPRFLLKGSGFYHNDYKVVGGSKVLH